MGMRHFLRQYWVPFLLLFLGPILGGAFSFWYFEIKAGQNAALGWYLPSAFAFLTGILSLQISLSEFEKRNTEYILETSNDFKKYIDDNKNSLFRIRRLSGQAIDAAVEGRLTTASICRNTLVNVAKDISLIQETATVSQIKRFLENEDKKWIDVTTVRDMQYGRYERLRGTAFGRGSSFDVALIESSSMIPNFLIIEDVERATDVFFGWIPDEDGRIEVFWTQHPSLLGLFQRYYRHLFKSHVELYESASIE